MSIAPVVRALATTLLLLGLLDVALRTTFPHFTRLRSSFSTDYLAREIRTLPTHRCTLVLGDSVLWGYGVPASQTAIARVRAREADWTNLAFAGGSAANSLAMLEAVLAAGIVPSRVIFNVNEKTFNPEDSAYERLYPAVEELAWPSLPTNVRRRLVPTLATSVDARIDRVLARVWFLYGARDDLRDAMFDDVDAAHAVLAVVERRTGTAESLELAHRPTPDRFEGTYDLDPIDDSNTQLVALTELAKLLRARDIPAIAILTPTNHRLLHAWIDVPAYRANLASIRHVLTRQNVRVVDLDSTFASESFIDNDHLTVTGNGRLAAIVQRAAP